MAGGNDLEQATAMIAAANKVVQDPSQVGSGLRTISLRLRGTSVSGELEEMGEDTTGLVSQSKMRDKILALSGVDILTDTGAYKETYEIIREIGHVWESMNDMDQAALLELMAGKNRSNILAAMLTNIEDLEGAYETALQSEGSAYRENEAYLDSIQGRIDIFTNSLQTFWMNFIDSDMVKWVVEQGTKLIQFLDTVPGKATAAAAGISILLKVTKGFDSLSQGLNAVLGTDFKKSKLGTVVDSFKNGVSDIVEEAKTATAESTKAEQQKAEAINKSAEAEESGAQAVQTASQEKVKASTESAQADKAEASASTAASNADKAEATASKSASASDSNEALASKAATEADVAETAASNAASTADMAESTASATSAEADMAEAIASDAASVADSAEATASQAAASADAAEATASSMAGTADAAEATASSIAATSNAVSGLASASNLATASFNKLKGVVVKHPFIAMAAAVAVAVAAINKFTTTAQEASEKSHDKFNEIANVFDTTKSNISNLENELSTIDSQISDLEGKNLSFTDDQELQRLKSQRTALENNLSIQKQLLKSQEQVKNEAAVGAMKDFIKASNEGAESAEKTGKAIGAIAGALMAIGGIAAAPVTKGKSLEVTAKGIGMTAGIIAGGAVIGGTAGSVVGSNVNAATVSTYDDWYKTYTDAYKEKSKAAADARKKYEKDPGDMDKYDEWQKLEQEAADVQSKMYDNLTQMQNYYSGIKYGQSAAMDKELDAWNNFLDKMNIEQNGANAKVNALDRIFGENASAEVKAFRKEIDAALKNKDNTLDIAAEIEGRDDLQELEDQLNEIGITTDEVSDYFRKTGEIGTKSFSDLSGEISAAETAVTNLQSALQKNTNEGYETRNSGIEEMKSLMEKGAIGSESNLWNIAEAMGFTYDSAKSIEANADALYKYIKVRDDWYQVDEDGEWGTAGADAFAKDIEKAIKNSKELQKLDIKWDFDASTGKLDFDFNNMQFDQIVEALSKTKEAAGLTNEEFVDMLKHLGQFYDVQWASGNDIVSYLEYLGTTGTDVKSQLEAVKEPLEQLLGKQDLNSKEIEDYLTGNGSLKKLPKDLQNAVAAYRKLRDEAEKPVKTQEINKTSKTKEKSSFIDKVKNFFTSDKSKETVSDKEKQGGKLEGTLSTLSMLSMFGIGALGKGKNGKFKGPANSLDNKGLLKSLGKGLGFSGLLSKGKGLFSSLLGKGKGLFTSLLGKGSLKGLTGLLGKGGVKGALGILGKGAFKVGSKFLGPVGWAASAATTVIPWLTKQFGKGSGLFSGLLGSSKKSQFKGPSNSLDNRGLFNFSGKGKGGLGALGKGASKVLSKGGFLGLGLGAVGAVAPWLAKKFTGKAKPDNTSVKSLNKKADLNAKVDKNVDKLSTFTDSAKELSKLDKNIKVDVTANVNGNVTEEFEYKLNNLKTFADSAKGLKDIGVVTSDVTANVDGNVIDTFEYKINNLKTFADSAKDISKIGDATSNVTANVDGNVIDEFEFKLNNLKTFSDSAKDIAKIGDATSNVTANVKGNVISIPEGFINNLKTFTDSAKDVSNIGEDVKASVTANIDGDVIDTFEYKIDNLKKFTDSAKDVSNIGEDVKAKVTANVDGDVIDTFEYKIDNLKKFTDSAKDIGDIGEDVKAKVTANVDGDVIDTFEYKIDNLKKFSDSAKDISNIGEDVKAKVTAEVDGDVIDTFEYKIDNLKKFSDSAKDVSSIGEDVKAKVTANVDGDVLDTFEYKIDNLKKFTDSAKEVSSIGEDVKAKVTANVEGDVIDTFEYKIDNLKKFTDSAKDVSNIGEDVKAKVTANVDGDVLDTFEYKIDNLKKFTDSAKDVSSIGEDVKAKVTAEVDGDVLDTFEYKIDNLKKFSDSAKDVSKIGKDVKAKVTAEVDGDVIDTAEYKIDNLKKFVDSAKDVSSIGKDVKSKVYAEVDGNVLTTPEKWIDNLKTFSDSAKDVSKVGKNVTSKVYAEVDGNVITTSSESIANLKTFSDGAKDISGIGKNVKASVKADIYGNILDDDDKISKLKRFGSIASTLASIPKVVISVTAKVATKAINSALSLLQKVKDSGLFKNYKASVTVKANVDSTEVDGYQPGEKTGTAKYEVDSSKVDSWKPPVKEGTIKYAPSIEALTYKQTHKTGTITYTPKIKGDGPVVNGTAHVKGTAFAGGTAFKQGDWRTKKDVTALTGELGQELVVPPNGSRWYTVGDNGAEFAHIPKGSIVFNHKQTEELFKNGYVTSGGGRGTVFANGTAYAEGTAYLKGKGTRKKYTFSYNSKTGSISKTSKSSKSKKSKKSGKNGESDFEEVFDWFEIRIEEINEDLDLMAAKLENAITIKGKNSILNNMIKTNKSELKTLDKGYKLYNSYAKKLYYDIPKKYRKAAANGKIAIEEFAGDADEKTLEKIKNYREWAQKAADVKKQIQEIKRTITELAKQKFDNIVEKYDNIASLQDNRQQHYTDMADLQDNKGEINSGKYYEAVISEIKEKQMNSLQNEKKRLQASLDASVKKGNIKKNSAEWYDMINQIHEVDSQIDECIANIEDYQNKINEIHFDNFEKKLNRVSRVAEETQNLIDLMADKDVVKTNAKGNVEWTNEGITQLGLYAQNMENAKKQSKLYAEEIDYLKANWEKMGMSENEYLEKLDELKDGQYDAIKAYNDSKDAIVDLQKARVDEIKNGIDKQIEAYEELIDKKKEELDAEKDLYDFQQSVLDQKKSISDIQRQLAALAGDNSASARAQRKKLEAELAKSQKELQDEYYDRSVEKQQEALDNELEQFTELRNKEKEEWDKWLEDIDKVFQDATTTVKNSGKIIKNTINEVGKTWDLTISSYVKTPWENASTAMSTTSSILDDIITKFDEAVKAADELADKQIKDQKEDNQDITQEKKDKFTSGQKVLATKGTVAYSTNSKDKKILTLGKDTNYTVVSVDNKTGMTKVKNSAGQIRYFETDKLKLSSSTGGSSGSGSGNKNSNNNTTKYPYGKASETTGLIQYGDKGKAVKAIQWALKELGYSIGSSGVDGSFGPATKAAVQKFQKNMKILANGIVGKDTRAKFKYKGYAKGSKKINKDQLALVDELGPELQLVAGKSGRLEYITRGSSIIPSDISENLMKLGQLDPSEILQHSKPSIGINPSVHNTEINLNVQYGDMLKIENFNGDDPDEIAKIVAKQFEKHTRDLNASLRKYVR